MSTLPGEALADLAKQHQPRATLSSAIYLIAKVDPFDLTIACNSALRGEESAQYALDSARKMPHRGTNDIFEAGATLMKASQRADIAQSVQNEQRRLGRATRVKTVLAGAFAAGGLFAISASILYAEQEAYNQHVTTSSDAQHRVVVSDNDGLSLPGLFWGEVVIAGMAALVTDRIWGEKQLLRGASRKAKRLVAQAEAAEQVS